MSQPTINRSLAVCAAGLLLVVAACSSASGSQADPKKFCLAVAQINAVGNDIVQAKDVAVVKADFAKEDNLVATALSNAPADFKSEVQAAQKILDTLNASLQDATTQTELAEKAPQRLQSTKDLVKATPKMQRYLMTTCLPLLAPPTSAASSSS